MKNRESSWRNSAELSKTNLAELSWTDARDSRGNGLKNQRRNC
jgi:hypothetical protein